MPQPHDTPPQVPTPAAPRDSSPLAAELSDVGGSVPFDKTSPEDENRYHHYTGNAIPWFVRGIWIIFWCYAITYVVLWLLPSLQSELLSPP
jgi:hypothetical protein